MPKRLQKHDTVCKEPGSKIFLFFADNTSIYIKALHFLWKSH